MATTVYTSDTTKKTFLMSEWARTNNTYSGCDMAATITVKTPAGVVMQMLGTVQTISVSTSQNKVPVRALGDINAKDYVDGPRTIAGSIIFTVFDKHWSSELREQLIDLGIFTNQHILADELPPFDVTISFANEYGYSSYMSIRGVRLMNEGQTMSINDIYTENTYQYVAMDLDYMKPCDYINGDVETLPSNIGDSSGEVTDIQKPVETIPTTSEPNVTPRPPVSPKLDDDFSYSRISPDSYSTLAMYAGALQRQKNAYLAKAKMIYNPYESEQKPKYDALVQKINDGYAKKLKEGIDYYGKK